MGKARTANLRYHLWGTTKASRGAVWVVQRRLRACCTIQTRVLEAFVIAHKWYRKLRLLNFVSFAVGTDSPRDAPTPHLLETQLNQYDLPGEDYRVRWAYPICDHLDRSPDEENRQPHSTVYKYNNTKSRQRVSVWDEMEIGVGYPGARYAYSGTRYILLLHSLCLINCYIHLTHYLRT